MPHVSIFICACMLLRVYPGHFLNRLSCSTCHNSWNLCKIKKKSMHECQPVQMFGGYIRSFRLEMLNCLLTVSYRTICDYNVKVVIIISFLNLSTACL